MSLKLKKPITIWMMALAVILPLAIGTTAASADEGTDPIPFSELIVTTVEPSPAPPEIKDLPVCIDRVNWSYTYDKTTGSGSVTASSEQKAQSSTLCDGLAIRAVSWKYDLPAAGNPSFPQTLNGFNDLLVEQVGTFSFGPVALDSCRQYDAYAQWASKGGFDKLGLPTKLPGSNEPYEPHEPPFLHTILKGKGPNPTYSSTSSEGCNTPPATPEPKVTTTNWQDSAFVCGDNSVTQNRTVTTTPYKVVLEDGQWAEVEDADNITIVSSSQTRELTDDEILSCQPATQSPVVVASDWVNSQVVCGDTTVTQTRVETKTTFMSVLVSGSTWETTSETTSSTATQVVPYTATKEQLDSCVVAVTPTNPVTPVSNATPTKPVAVPPATLASTGFEAGPIVFGSVFLLMLLGAGFVVVDIRRRKAIDE